MAEAIFLNPWIWITLTVLLLCLVAFIAGARNIAKYEDEAGVGSFLSFTLGGMGALIIPVVYFGVMLPPYDASFYMTYRITGEVTQIESAFSGDEGTMSQVFIAKVDGVEYFIKSSDQRFRTLNEGDDVTLVCTKGFEYFQEPWYSCAFGSN